MMNLRRFALIFVLVHSIHRCDAQQGNAKCGLDGKTVNMTLDNGPAAVYFLTGKGETCIAGVDSKLPFKDAKRSCQKLFSGGKMMSDENFGVLEPKIKGNEFEKIGNFYMISSSECSYVINDVGTLKKRVCPSTGIFNYVCEYPMQYNCAWQFEYAETSSQSYAANVTIYAYGNELGNKPKEDCNMQQSVPVAMDCNPKLLDEPSEWSPCSETCTDVAKPPPRQNMTRKLNPKCVDKPSGTEVFLRSVRSCNGHVPCNASSTDTTTATASSLRLVGIIIGAVVGSVVLAVVVAFGIWFFCCRRKRGNTDVTEKSTTSKRSKVSQRSRNSASMQQRPRSQSPGKRKTRKTKETTAGDSPKISSPHSSEAKVIGFGVPIKFPKANATTLARAEALSLPPKVGAATMARQGRRYQRN